MKSQICKSLLILITLASGLRAHAIPHLTQPDLAAQAGPSELEQLTHKTNAYASDTRKDLNSNKSPWTSIGRLVAPNGGLCSATLVGADLILTAAHCILDKEGQLLKGKYQFQAGYNHGRVFGSAGVLRAWWGSRTGHYTENDWAIMQLDARLGDRLGWMGMRNTSSDGLLANREVLFLAAYGSDYAQMEKPYWQRDCNFRGRFTEVEIVKHDCSMSRGSSGGSMFVWDAAAGAHYIVAVNVAERRKGDTSQSGVFYSDDTANFAIPTHKFFPTLVQILGR